MKKHLLILFSFLSLTIASSLEEYLTYKRSGYIDITGTVGEHRSSMINEIGLNNDLYIGDNIRLTVTPIVKTYNYNHRHNHNVSEKYVLFYLNELFVSYNINKNLIISAGIFSGKNNWLNISNNKYTSTGIGLYGISDISLQSFIITYMYGNSEVNFYAATFNKIFNGYLLTNDNSELKRNIDSFKGTNTMGIYGKYNIDKRNTLYYQYHHIRMKDQIKTAMILDTYSIGWLWDDKHYSGLQLYGLAAISKINKRDIKGTKYEYMENESDISYYLMLGSKYDIDNLIFNKDTELGIEYTYASRNHIKTSLSTTEYPRKFSEHGHHVLLYGGIYLNNNTKLRLRYFYHDSGKINSVMESIEKIKDLKRYHGLQLQLFITY